MGLRGYPFDIYRTVNLGLVSPAVRLQTPYFGTTQLLERRDHLEISRFRPLHRVLASFLLVIARGLHCRF